MINYAISVSNVGNTALTGITVTDPSVSNLAAVMSGGFNVGDVNHDNSSAPARPGSIPRATR